MKNIAKFLVAAAMLSSTAGCETFLDVNDNPNSITTDAVQPYLILAQALKVTGDTYGLTLNSNYGNWVAGFWAKTGTVNGFNAERTYVYSTTYQQGLWYDTYNNLKDYDDIVTSGEAQGQPYHSAIAKIMKVFNYQLLVDEYGDIPYTQSLQGASGNITPTYDKAEDIYKDFIVKLDEAIATLASEPVGARAVGTEDIVFGGNLANWRKFANNLKLRILIRQSSVTSLDSYIRTEMAKLQSSVDGFINTDVVVQPGYLQTAGKQNPIWNMYRATPTGGTATYYNWVAGTDYILAQYQNNKDPRLSQLYLTVTNTTSPYVGKYKGVVLGEADPIPGGTGLSRYRTYGGIYKGFDAPVPLMLAAETYFLQAEAKSRSNPYLPGGDAAAKSDFNNGIRASFVYYYTPAPSRRNTTSDVSANAVTDYNAYLAANPTNPLVNWDVAGNTKLEKIIYQKYLAENAVTGIEAWNDYRRTGYPKFPASVQSASPRTDKLPTRLLYPQYELSTNSANVPAGVDQFTKIFWDVVD
ncbi:SusD/RagB family nutrient-binding outer membrane lipoprotein [Hymenobacter sp. NBH84]|uniref:SusD/RagB family nutrient-binding outer membrane lipoprotein n=1 Tax=Hymenobacter sp. NBH84 TaxID=2596915 RepID=UPI00162414E1|nr:SusD/RagB family nutrient-binding outer membrane lipoprotein [Hymenobacter sp. NBH84]QNE40380.1 SusD/RagB family nutrient-binding outer membrane lipoprotein [Hymenobacter sp. NBH84]